MQPELSGESVHVVVELRMRNCGIDLRSAYIPVSQHPADAFNRDSLGEGDGCGKRMARCMKGNGPLNAGFLQDPAQADVAPSVARQREDRIGCGLGPVF